MKLPYREAPRPVGGELHFRRQSSALEAFSRLALPQIPKIPFASFVYVFLK